MSKQKPLIIAVSVDQKVKMLKGMIKNLTGRRFGATNVKISGEKREWKGVSVTAIQSPNIKDHQLTVVEPNSDSQARTLELETVTEFRADGSILQFI